MWFGQEVNGGALYVGQEGYVQFNSRVGVYDLSVMSADTSTDTWSGGCVYNQVRSASKHR